MLLTRQIWNNYIALLSKCNEAASDLMKEYMEKHGLPVTTEQRQELLDFAFSLSTKYGEAAATLACEMYDSVGALSGMILEPAIPAETATYGEVAKTVNGTMKTSKDLEVISSAVGRLVKMAGADTMLQNAQRDGAQFAWIPSGDTCAFCIALASRGWQYQSKNAMKGGHAEHIHSNCDCTYAVRFNDNFNVEGYDPDEYYEQYSEADGHGAKQKVNAMRRKYYAENKERINAQKRSAYQKRKELNSSAAEEINVN